MTEPTSPFMDAIHAEFENQWPEIQNTFSSLWAKFGTGAASPLELKRMCLTLFALGAIATTVLMSGAEMTENSADR